jgi:anti-sigma factor RsiW
MNARDRHQTEALGAYVLGALDEAEATAVADHLAFCADCRALADDFATVSDALGEVPAEAFLEGPPDGGDLLLRRTLRRVRRERSARQRPRWLTSVAVAAVAVGLALGGGIVLGRGSGGPEQPVALPPPGWSTTPGPATHVTGRDGDAKLDATILPASGWVRVEAWVSGIPAGERCELVVESRSGQVVVVGGWLVPAKADNSPTALYGSALVAPDQVARVVVRNTAGHVFVGAPT